MRSTNRTTETKPGKQRRAVGVPADVAAIRKAIKDFLDQKDGNRAIGNTKHGIYAFYDYDAEPIYVGQTEESLRGRIGRHLTNQRTDAVAMNVLDPFEVAEIEVWPFQFPVGASKDEIQLTLAAAEYTVYQKVLGESALQAVLNEKDIPITTLVPLPTSYRSRIIPDEIYEARKHPDIRIARRASTISRLARVISERDVSPGLRRTLLIQAKRLERLSRQRLEEVSDAYPQEQAGEETGE